MTTYPETYTWNKCENCILNVILVGSCLIKVNILQDNCFALNTIFYYNYTELSWNL